MRSECHSYCTSANIKISCILLLVSDIFIRTRKIPVRSECHSYCTSVNIRIFFLVKYSNDILKKSYLDSINNTSEEEICITI